MDERQKPGEHLHPADTVTNPTLPPPQPLPMRETDPQRSTTSIFDKPIATSMRGSTPPVRLRGGAPSKDTGGDGEGKGPEECRHNGGGGMGRDGGYGRPPVEWDRERPKINLQAKNCLISVARRLSTVSNNWKSQPGSTGNVRWSRRYPNV